ncbi:MULTISPECIES: hypothetical protein [Streptomyces]|uniref:hypothetical protein n=1 Tax=Streptomyces sp. NPDC021608 TaxID=3154903 RepID=UPI002119BD46|nr:hypothetical protein [Streptomyces hilarionis]MCQ9136405.1 hypothetical protein [Streptomyces hilarionis]
MAAALACGTLLVTAAACSNGDDGAAGGSDVAAAPVAGRTTAPAPLPLTNARARMALITAADLEDDWTQVKTAGNWHDRLLVGKVDVARFVTARTQAAACQQLLDGLYENDMLGKPSGGSALTGFQQDEARLFYQVAAYDKADLDKSLAWLKSLPTECDQFNAVGAQNATRSVQVVAASLPKVGDARQGITVTVKGSSGGSPVTLTLDVAVVRVGDDAITVVNGGTDGVDHDSTDDAVSHGVTRLKDVLAGRTPAPQPSLFD